MGGSAKRGTVLGDVAGNVGDAVNNTVNAASPTVANLGGLYHHYTQAYRDFATFNWQGASKEAGMAFKSGEKAVGLGASEPQPIDEPAAPKRADATDAAVTEERLQNFKRRQGRTNLTGGQGVMDSPQTASTVLLGS